MTRSIDLSWSDNSGNEDGFRIYRGTSSGNLSSYTTVGSNTTSYSDTNISKDTTYYYRVEAYNSDGTSGKTSEVSQLTAPADPTNITQTVNGNEDIAISWTNNSSTVDNFRLQVSEDGGSYSTIATPSSGTTSYNYTATSSTNEHQFRVRAENSTTSSNYNTSSTVATDPSGLVVDSHGSTSVSLSWSGVRDASNYRVFRAEATGSTISDYTEVGTPSTSSVTDSGLENGELYYYRVQAVYSGSNSQLSGEVSQTTDLPAPSIDSIDNSIEDEFTISYTLNDNSSDGDVVIQESTDGGSTFSDIGSNSPPENSFTTTGLNDGQKYFYKIKRNTDHANQSSGTISEISFLPAPSGFKVDSINVNSYELSWSVGHNNGNLRVYISTDGGTTWTDDSGSLALSTSTYTTTGLSSSDEHKLKVEAETDHTTKSSTILTKALAGFVVRSENGVQDTNENGVVMTTTANAG